MVTGSGSAFCDNQYGANEKLPIPVKSAELICCPENGARDFLRKACRYQIVRCHIPGDGQLRCHRRESLRFHMLGKAVLHDAEDGLSIGVFYSLFSLFGVCLSSYALKLHALCYRSGWPVIGIV